MTRSFIEYETMDNDRKYTRLIIKHDFDAYINHPQVCVTQFRWDSVLFRGLIETDFKVIPKE
jgi:hypothetical protein